MATRPWVTPDEVRDYSENSNVQKRTDVRLKMDITRAEQYVITYTRNDFSNAEKFPTIPENVHLAVILIAEQYAIKAATIKSGAYKSETFDDYSYTLRETEAMFENLSLGSLLDEFKNEDKGTVTMKMRKL
jgi:hypothetical protein